MPVVLQDPIQAAMGIENRPLQYDFHAWSLMLIFATTPPLPNFFGVSPKSDK